MEELDMRWCMEELAKLHHKDHEQDLAILELTKSINNGIRDDIREILETLKSMATEDKKSAERIDALESSKWFLSWVEKVRDNLFKTTVKIVALFLIGMAALSVGRDKGMLLIKRFFEVSK